MTIPLLSGAMPHVLMQAISRAAQAWMIANDGAYPSVLSTNMTRWKVNIHEATDN